jgi:hypothetical protein
MALEADGPSGSIFGVLSTKQAYKVARNLLKDFALECIADEATRQNLSPLIREKRGQKRSAKSASKPKTFQLIGRSSPRGVWPRS